MRDFKDTLSKINQANLLTGNVLTYDILIGILQLSNNHENIFARLKKDFFGFHDIENITYALGDLKTSYVLDHSFYS